ncbi:MAG: hypothetical protein ACPGYV_09490 [Phycisphaeraceae bacterium]
MAFTRPTASAQDDETLANGMPILNSLLEHLAFFLASIAIAK